MNAECKENDWIYAQCQYNLITNYKYSQYKNADDL